MRLLAAICLFITVLGVGSSAAVAQLPDQIFHHGKIVTVDERFTIAEALAVRGDRIQAVGSNDDVLKLADRFFANGSLAVTVLGAVNGLQVNQEQLAL